MYINSHAGAMTYPASFNVTHVDTTLSLPSISASISAATEHAHNTDTHTWGWGGWGGGGGGGGRELKGPTKIATLSACSSFKLQAGMQARLCIYMNLRQVLPPPTSFAMHGTKGVLQLAQNGQANFDIPIALWGGLYDISVLDH